MAILFDGRFDNAARPSGTGGARFSSYAKLDANPVAISVIDGAGVSGQYEYVENFRGLSRVALLTAPLASTSRIELRPYTEDPAGSGPVYGTRWYWWSTLVPDDWVFNPSRGVDAGTDLVGNQRCIIAQVHETADGGDTVHFPPVQLYIENDAYVLATTADTNATTVARCPNLRVLGKWPVVRNRWVDWVLNVKWAADTTGFINFYKDRRLVYNATGIATTYNDSAGLFMKAGLYWFGDMVKDFGITRRLYSRGIVVGDANSSHLEVSGLTVLDRAAMRSCV